MILSVHIPHRPITLNSATKHSCRGGRVSTRKSIPAINFIADMNDLLYVVRDELEAFALYVDTLDNPCFVACYEISLNNCETKKGLISRTAGDWTNLVKVAEDCLFKALNAYSKAPDDALILDALVTKKHGSDGIKIMLEAIEYGDYKSRNEQDRNYNHAQQH